MHRIALVATSLVATAALAAGVIAATSQPGHTQTDEGIFAVHATTGPHASELIGALRVIGTVTPSTEEWLIHGGVSFPLDQEVKLTPVGGSYTTTADFVAAYEAALTDDNGTPADPTDDIEPTLYDCSFSWTAIPLP